MKNKLIIITMFTFCLSANLFAQGLNNEEYDFDKSDFENIQKIFFGIDTYKFNVDAKNNEDYDIVIEEYKNQEIINTTSLISEIVEIFGGVNPISSKTGDDFIRMYVKNNIKEKRNVHFNISYLNMSIPKKIENLDISIMQTRAFGSVPSQIEKKTPVMAIYGNNESEFISCPGDAKPEDVIKSYDWVVIMYLDKIKSS